MNKRILHSKMVLYGDRNSDLADILNLTPQRLSAKINEYKGADFTAKEIFKIKDRYNLSAMDINEIFFTN